jgi:hypothetical protein
VRKKQLEVYDDKYHVTDPTPIEWRDLGWTIELEHSTSYYEELEKIHRIGKSGYANYVAQVNQIIDEKIKETLRYYFFVEGEDPDGKNNWGQNFGDSLNWFIKEGKCKEINRARLLALHALVKKEGKDAPVDRVGKISLGITLDDLNIDCT